MADFLSSFASELLPFDVAGGVSFVNPPDGIPGPATPATRSDGSTIPDLPTPGQELNNLIDSANPIPGILTWLEGVVLQMAFILLGLVLLAAALYMLARREIAAPARG